MFNLYPINFWILYAAIAVLLIVLIVTLLQISKKVKEAGAFIKPLTDDLQKYVKLTQIKLDVLDENKKANEKKNKYLKIALPILLAIYERYKKDDEAQGVKGVVKSAQGYVNDRNAEKKLIKKIIASM